MPEENNLNPYALSDDERRSLMAPGLYEGIMRSHPLDRSGGPPGPFSGTQMASMSPAHLGMLSSILTAGSPSPPTPDEYGRSLDPGQLPQSNPKLWPALGQAMQQVFIQPRLDALANSIPRPGMTYGEQIQENPKTIPSLLESSMRAAGGPLVTAPARRSTLGAMGGAMKVGGALETGERGMRALPDLRAMDTDSAIKLARQQIHLIPDKSGQLYGAPRGVQSKDDVKAMRKGLDNYLKLGSDKTDFYQRGRDLNVEMAGPDPHKQALAAGEEAHFSPQATPDTNLGFMMQAHNAYERGQPLAIAHTGAQARKYVAEREAGGTFEGAKKTGPYGQSLDPTRPLSTVGTNDIWHARAFGYTDPDGKIYSGTPTEQMHRFMDYETLLAVDRANKKKFLGRSDWTSPEIQSGIWFGAKRAAGEAEGQDYYQMAPKYTASATHEQLPGASTGLTIPEGRAQEFQRASTWRDPTGRDPLYADQGYWTRPSTEGVGAYRNSLGEVENNPVTVSRPMLDYQTTPEGKVIHPGTAASLDATERVRALTDMQEAAAWNKIIPAGKSMKPGEGIGLVVSPGRPLAAEDMLKLNDIAGRHGFIAANHEGGGVAFIPDGSAVVSNMDTTKKLSGALGEELRQSFPGADIIRGKPQGSYLPFGGAISKEQAGQGQATGMVLKQLEEMRQANPGQYEKLLDSAGLSKKAKDNLDRLHSFNMKGQRQDYENYLEIVRDSRLRGLIEHVKRYGPAGLPAIAGAAALPAAVGSSNQNREP